MSGRNFSPSVRIAMKLGMVQGKAIPQGTFAYGFDCTEGSREFQTRTSFCHTFVWARPASLGHCAGIPLRINLTEACSTRYRDALWPKFRLYPYMVACKVALNSDRQRQRTWTSKIDLPHLCPGRPAGPWVLRRYYSSSCSVIRSCSTSYVTQ